MKIILSAITLIFYLSSNGQSNNYSKFVNYRLINKKQTVKTDGDEKDITYLGKIQNKNGKTIFYVLTVFEKVQAAIVIHGHSNIIYLDNNKDFKRQFELGAPNDLPFKLKHNNLYYRYINPKTDKREVYVNYVGNQIPKVMCVAPNDCY